MGFHLSEDELSAAFERFLKVADKKKEIFDEDLAAIVEDEIHHVPEYYRLDYFHISSGTTTIPTSTVRMIVGGEGETGIGVGRRPGRCDIQSDQQYRVHEYYARRVLIEGGHRRDRGHGRGVS